MGLEELAHKATTGNHIGWRSSDVFSNSTMSNSLQGRRSSLPAFGLDLEEETPPEMKRNTQQRQGMGGSFKGGVTPVLQRNPTEASTGGRRFSIESSSCLNIGSMSESSSPVLAAAANRGAGESSPLLAAAAKRRSSLTGSLGSVGSASPGGGKGGRRGRLLQRTVEVENPLPRWEDDD